MPGKPLDTNRSCETDQNSDRPTLTDRLNKYLLCAYLNRLNEEDCRAADANESNYLEEEGDLSDSLEAFSD